jgi:predicted outer membrane repeat protein
LFGEESPKGHTASNFSPNLSFFSSNFALGTGGGVATSLATLKPKKTLPQQQRAFNFFGEKSTLAQISGEISSERIHQSSC